VVFAIDRAGLVGSDGETHQGIFDLSYLGNIPNMSIFAPKNDMELSMGLEFGLLKYNGPFAMRYPRGIACDRFHEFAAPVVYGKSEVMYMEESIALFAVGNMVEIASDVRDMLKSKGFCVSLINARFVKPIDVEILHECAQNHDLLVTREENVP
jgi:1-deoxy-D-xylulose-5-phosphate synthase